MNTGKGQHIQKQYDMRIQKLQHEYRNTGKGQHIQNNMI